MLAVRPETPRLTVGVMTRNRPESLRRCLASLTHLGELVSEVIVIDDASEEPPLESLKAIPATMAARLTFVAQPGGRGPIVGRNAIVRRASTAFVLLLDDDTVLLDRAPFVEALEIMERHREVAAVACAQANEDGSPWPPGAQPAPVDYPCLVPAFTGFAHLVRREDFLEMGGYRESFEFYGEEKELCLRLLDAGRLVLYLPHARVVHAPDPSGRSASRYLRQVIRNDCLGAMYNEPLPFPLASVPLRLYRYFVMRRHQQVNDRGGFVWIVRELIRLLPDVMRSRRPVRWQTLRRWRGLRTHPPRFESRVHPGGGSADDVGAPHHLARADFK
jgi:GT2 family glycosyltransferase